MAKNKIEAEFPKREPIPLRPPSPPISPLNRSDSKYVQSYAVRNIQFNEDSRTTVAVVGQEGKTGVDYTVLQEAIDYAFSLGGGNIFIKAGTHRPSKFITLRDNVYLIGEDPERTIIDFSSAQLANNESGIFAGGSNIYNLPSGTVAFTNGSKTITSSTATFLQAKILAGDIAFIAFTPFVVQSVDTDNQITLTKVWEGATGTVDALSILRPKRNIFLKNLTLKEDGGGTGHGGLLFTWCDKVGAEKVVAKEFSGIAFTIESSFNFLISECEAKYSLTGFEAHNQVSTDVVNSGQFLNCISWNNSSRGFNVEDTAQVSLLGCKAISNNLGFRLNANNTVVSNSYAQTNNLDGIRIDDASYCIASNNVSRANGSAGIATVLTGTSPDNAVISGNNLLENAGDAIFLDGDDGVVIGNSCDLPENGTGIDLSGNADENNIVGNILDGNGNSSTTGIEVDSGATGNFLNGNKFVGVTTATTDAGTSTVRASKFVALTTPVSIVSANPGDTDWVPVDVSASVATDTYAINVGASIIAATAGRSLFLRSTGSGLSADSTTTVVRNPAISAFGNHAHPTVETDTSQSFDYSVNNADVSSVVIILRGYHYYTD